MFSTTKTAPRIGELLLKRNLITSGQLQTAMTAQALSHRPLGEILVSQGLVSRRQVQRSLRWQSVLRLGALLVALAIWPFAAQADASGLRVETSAVAASIAAWLPTMDRMSGATNFNGAGSTRAANSNFTMLAARFKRDLRGYLGTPMYTLLKGEYRGGAGQYTEGMAYQATWSKKSVRFEVKYQF